MAEKKRNQSYSHPSLKGKKLNGGGIRYGPTSALVGEYSEAKNNPDLIARINKLSSLFKEVFMETRIKEIVKDMLDESLRQGVIMKSIEYLGMDNSRLEVNIIDSVFDLLEFPTEDENPGWRDHLYHYGWELLEQINPSDVLEIVHRCSDKLCNLSDDYLKWLIQEKKSLNE